MSIFKCIIVHPFLPGKISKHNTFLMSPEKNYLPIHFKILKSPPLEYFSNADFG